MNFYRARTRIGAPGNPKAEAGEVLPLSDADATELNAIDAIDPEPFEISGAIVTFEPQPIISEALIAPVVRPLDAAPAASTAPKAAAAPRAPRKPKAATK